jgi:hypothetical protein
MPSSDNSSNGATIKDGYSNMEPKYSELGAWVMEQRRLYRAKKLLPERQEALQRLVDGGLLSWSIELTPLERWYISYDFALTYKMNYGNCNVPFDYEVVHDLSGATIKVGEWLSAQLLSFREGKLTTDMHDKIGVI